MPINGEAPGPSFDKIAHVLLFAFVSMNVCFYFLSNKNHLILVSIFICTLPFLTEFLQKYIQGRNFDVNDIMADVLGIFFGIIIYFLFKNLIIKVYTLLGEITQIENLGQ